MELLSVFLSPPLFRVLHGRQELGYVDELTFLGKQEGARVLLLGGRAWRVTHVDWSAKTAYVETSEDRGRSRWKGECRGLGFRLCQAIKRVLSTDVVDSHWSHRAGHRLAELREDFAWLTENETVVLTDANGHRAWWTFAGYGANASLSPALSNAVQCRIVPDSFSLTFDGITNATELERAIRQIRASDAEAFWPNVDETALQSLKFSDCLPRELALDVLRLRLRDQAGLELVLRAVVRFVVAGSSNSA